LLSERDDQVDIEQKLKSKKESKLMREGEPRNLELTTSEPLEL